MLIGFFILVRFIIVHFGFLFVGQQEAITWIRTSSSDNRDAMDAYLAGRKNLKLEFDIFEFQDGDIDLLAYFLRRTDAVTDFSSNGRHSGGNSSRVGLFDALAESKVLERFSLINVDGSNTLGAADQIVALLRLLEQCPIRTLLLDIDHFREEDIARMCNALADKPLECLDLGQYENTPGEDPITLEGASIIGRFVGTHPTLNDLTLTGLLDGKGLAAFLPGLENSPCLRKLNFERCEFKDHMLAALAEYLKLSRLKELTLHGNSCESPGFLFAEALKENRTLEILTLQLRDMERYRHIFGVDEQAAFIDALGHNVTLTQLTLRRCSDATIDGLLSRNKNLIPTAVRRAALFLIGICRSTNYEGMGDFAVFPTEIIRMLAQAVWATRRDPIWIQALE